MDEWMVLEPPVHHLGHRAYLIHMQAAKSGLLHDEQWCRRSTAAETAARREAQ